MNSDDKFSGRMNKSENGNNRGDARFGRRMGVAAQGVLDELDEIFTSQRPITERAGKPTSRAQESTRSTHSQNLRPRPASPGHGSDAPMRQVERQREYPRDHHPERHLATGSAPARMMRLAAASSNLTSRTAMENWQEQAERKTMRRSASEKERVRRGQTEQHFYDEEPQKGKHLSSKKKFALIAASLCVLTFAGTYYAGKYLNGTVISPENDVMGAFAETANQKQIQDQVPTTLGVAQSLGLNDEANNQSLESAAETAAGNSWPEGAANSDDGEDIFYYPEMDKYGVVFPRPRPKELSSISSSLMIGYASTVSTVPEAVAREVSVVNQVALRRGIPDKIAYIPEKSGTDANKPKIDLAEEQNAIAPVSILTSLAQAPKLRPDVPASFLKSSKNKSSKVASKSSGKIKPPANLGTYSKKALQTLVANEAKRHGVPVKFAFAIATQESNWRPQVVGGAGEVGMFQIKPATAHMLGYRGSTQDLFHPKVNTYWAMRYLRMAYVKARGDLPTAAGLYNAGLGAKKLSNDYVSSVRRRLARM